MITVKMQILKKKDKMEIDDSPYDPCSAYML